MKRTFKVTFLVENDYDEVSRAEEHIETSLFRSPTMNVIEVISCKQLIDVRTLKQNNALYKYFSMLSEELNSAGLDVQKTLSPKLEHPWNAELVKELIWRPVQEACLGKKSTTELSKQKDIDVIYDVINRHMGQNFGIYVPFPSEEHRRVS